MIDLPIGIKKAIRQKKRFRLVFFISSLLLIILILFFWGGRLFHFPANHPIVRYAFYSLLVVSPVFFTKIYLIFTDKEFLGEVKKVEVSTVVDSKSSAKPTRESLYTKNVIVIIVEDESGNIIKKKVDESPANPNSEYVRYKVGDMVLHLHGTGVTVVLPRNNERTCNCVMCGFSNDLSNEVCSRCGYQLIKYDMGKKTYKRV